MALNVVKDVETVLRKYMQTRHDNSALFDDKEFLECLVTKYLQLEMNLCDALEEEFYSKLQCLLQRFKRFNSHIDPRELKGSLRKQVKQVLLELNDRQMENEDVMNAEPIVETVPEKIAETVTEKIILPAPIPIKIEVTNQVPPKATPENPVKLSVPLPIKIEVINEVSQTIAEKAPETIAKAATESPITVPVPMQIKTEETNEDSIKTKLESFLRSKDTQVPENLMEKQFLVHVLKEYLKIKVNHLTGDQRRKAYNEVHWNMRGFKECSKRRNIPFEVLKIEWLKEYLLRRIKKVIGRMESGEVAPQVNDAELLQVKQELLDENLASEAKIGQGVEETAENNSSMDIDEPINDQIIDPTPKIADINPRLNTNKPKNGQILDSKRKNPEINPPMDIVPPINRKIANPKSKSTIEEDEIPLEHRKKSRSKAKPISFDFTPSELAKFKFCSIIKGDGTPIYDHIHTAKDTKKFSIKGLPAPRTSRKTLELKELPYWPDVGIKLVLPDFTITRYCTSNKKYKLVDANSVRIDIESLESNSSELFLRETTTTSNKTFSCDLICEYIKSMLKCLEFSEYVSRGQIKFILEKMHEDFKRLSICMENVSYSYFLNDQKYYRVFEQSDVEISKSETLLNLREIFNPEIVFSIERTNNETEIDKGKISVYFKELLQRMEDGEEEVFDTIIPEGYFLYCVGCQKDGNSPLGRFNTKRIAYLSEHLGPHCMEKFKCVKCNFIEDIPQLALDKWKHSCDNFL